MDPGTSARVRAVALHSITTPDRIGSRSEMICEVVLAVALLAAGGITAPAPDPAFHVIVHRSNPVNSLTRAELSAIFMRRVRSWQDRSEILPVDQTVDSPLRDQFSRTIHGKNAMYVIRYWQRLIFAGRGIPPPEQPSSAAVLEHVRSRRGAIGYVDAREPLPDDVKVLVVTR